VLTRVRLPEKPGAEDSAPHYALEADGAFRIDGYDFAPGFCSFLPGIAGPDGAPLWCLYVNRAQGVVSFGVQDKDHAIAEYLPATWAYQLVGVQGFRTFCKIDGAFYEPFRAGVANGSSLLRSLRIRMDSLELSETGAPHGLAFTVRYFSPVSQPLGTLVRQLTVTNVSTMPRRLNVLDGLPFVVPAGLTDPGLKTLRHIHEAYASVRLACDHVPYYTAKVAAHDEAEVVRLDGGNFYAAWLARRDEFHPLQPLVDPHLVFGAAQDLITPRNFIGRDALDRDAQVWENRMPCALVPFQAVLEPHESVELFAIAGYTPNERLLADFLPRFAQRAAFGMAANDSRRLIDEVVTPATTISSQPALNAYAQQNYLDNILRGGVPRMLPSTGGPTPLYLYARRHGDLERDYNHFVVPAHPLSSGAGNYRDICQNRRDDVWFYPDVQDHEIGMFLALLQVDGYNPLAIEGYRWRLAAGVAAGQLCTATDEAARAEFCRLVQHGFQPGELLQWATLNGIDNKERMPWLSNVLAHCDRTLVAHGHAGGYWIDHWTYVTDLLEAFASVYPDQVERSLVGVADIGWFDEGAYVAPRAEKYTERAGGPLQIHAVADGRPAPQPLPPVTKFAKLCALIAIKAVSFDYACRGIEMEAGRPSWNDSLNGLPGLFGSSTCEAAELGRLCAWLRRHLPQAPDTALPSEVADFVEQVVTNLGLAEYSWDHATTLREQFRARVSDRISGQERTVPGSVLNQLLAGAERRARAAMNKSVDPQSGLVHTYYVNQPELSSQDPSISLAERIRSFKAQPLPLFLEGQVHWLRLQDRPDAAQTIYRAVRASPLFDSALQMYKLNECLAACPPEIGRARTFTRGWFENESIWLHMSYKYLLELLRAGLYTEFFADAQTMLVPFMDPQVYGRSILENSSFLASSANPDVHTRGRGFIARLSGSTAEFIHIWLLLTLGPAPFYLENEQLHFRLRPILPGAWFTVAPTQLRDPRGVLDIPQNCFACRLLGTMMLVYHNESRGDTFGPSGVRPVRYQLDGGDAYDGRGLGSDLAARVRARECRRLDVWLAPD
jgi:hypothetical protein